MEIFWLEITEEFLDVYVISLSFFFKWELLKKGLKYEMLTIFFLLLFLERNTNGRNVLIDRKCPQSYKDLGL
jgi:hypothetical protein